MSDIVVTFATTNDNKWAIRNVEKGGDQDYSPAFSPVQICFGSVCGPAVEELVATERVFCNLGAAYPTHDGAGLLCFRDLGDRSLQQRRSNLLDTQHTCGMVIFVVEIRPSENPFSDAESTRRKRRTPILSGCPPPRFKILDAAARCAIVVKILSAHDRLQALHLMTAAYDDRFMSFPAIPRLRSLSVDQPTGWVTFISSRRTAGFLAWIGRTIGASSAQLEPMRFPHTSDCAELCTILQQENVRLKGVHAASLIVLRLPECEQIQEGPWALKGGPITLISQLKHLETLEIAVDAWGPGALRAIVYRLLEMVVDSMPALKNIAILPAYSPHSGGCNRNSQLDRYAEYGLAQIEATVRDFEKESKSADVTRLVSTHRRRLEDIETIARGYIILTRKF
ncbi:hypothetical protein B0H19DRAFT_1064359 [Mycena capillaripes]|nr:hypothetical protein B0H19DRAFT_1064359 [Mycena capillaripes]